MRKLFALMYKDLLLLIRDRAGVVFLFVMPLVLVLVMTGIGDGALQSASRKNIPVLVLNLDDGEVGHFVIDNLQELDMFDVVLADSLESEQGVQRMIQDGKYLMGVCVPQNTTTAVQEMIQSELSAIIGFDDGADLEHQEVGDLVSPNIKVFIDPTMSPSFRTTMLTFLRESSLRIEIQALRTAIAENVQEYVSVDGEGVRVPDFKSIVVDEVVCSPDSFRAGINVTEHNVPAWTLFAIFFIVISLAGGMVKERLDGSFSRLVAMSCSYWLYLVSKILVYETVCIVQFLLVLLMGQTAFPLVGLTVFSMHGAFLLCLVIVVFCALASIGIGLVLGIFATTQQQASVCGAVLVVVLSAIGGIWVPPFLMPPFLNSISGYSPLNWGLEAFYDVILRGHGIRSIIPNCSLLLGLSAVCTVVSIMGLKSSRQNK